MTSKGDLKISDVDEASEFTDDSQNQRLTLMDKVPNLDSRMPYKVNSQKKSGLGEKQKG